MNSNWKARLVANGSTAEAPVSLTYPSVASKDIVRLELLIAMNNLYIMACDIGNEYLNAPRKRRFGPRQVKNAVRNEERLLYWYNLYMVSRCQVLLGKSMLKAFIENNLNFKSTLIDPNVYIRRNRGDDGTQCYEPLLVCVDGVLAVSHSPESIMNYIGLEFDIKDNNYGPPTSYLGTNVEPFQMSDGKYTWSIKCDYYVAEVVKTIKYLLFDGIREFKSGKRLHKGQLPHGYNPEMDVTDECDAEHVSKFQKLIGILQWEVELGRIDVQIEVVFLPQYQAFTLEVHLEAL